jgi:Trk K+ transport system NAD-binding subunit
MKIIICGAGRIADELLKRVGTHWEITVIDKDETKLAPFSRRFDNVSPLMAEDASSRWFLKRPG